MSDQTGDDVTPEGDPIRTYTMWLRFPEGETAITADATRAVAAFEGAAKAAERAAEAAARYAASHTIDPEVGEG